MSAIFAFIIAATIILTISNLVFATSFQQKPQIATQPSSPSGTTAIMAFNKIGSSSSIYASSSTAKDPYEHISSNNINSLQLQSPLVSRTNINNVHSSAYTTTTIGNPGSKPITRTIPSMTMTSEPSHPQQQVLNPTSTEILTSQGPSQLTTVPLSLVSQITCNPTELLRNSKCSPQNTSCDPIGISQDSKCSIRPHHHIFMSIRSFRHR